MSRPDMACPTDHPGCPPLWTTCPSVMETASYPWTVPLDLEGHSSQAPVKQWHLNGALSLAPPSTSTRAPVQGLPVSSFPGGHLSADGSAVRAPGPVITSLASSLSASSAFVPSLDPFSCAPYQSSVDQLPVEMGWHDIGSMPVGDIAHGLAPPVLAGPSSVAAGLAATDHKQALCQMSIDGASAMDLGPTGSSVPAYLEPLSMSRVSSDLVLPLSLHSVPARGSFTSSVTSGDAWESFCGGPVDVMAGLAIPTSRSSSVDGTETLLAALVAGPREPDSITSMSPGSMMHRHPSSASNDPFSSEDWSRYVPKIPSRAPLPPPTPLLSFPFPPPGGGGRGVEGFVAASPSPI